MSAIQLFTPTVPRTVYQCLFLTVKEKETINFSESVGAVNTDSPAVVFQSSTDGESSAL